MNSMQNGAPTPAESQKPPQRPQNRPENGPQQPVSLSAIFAAEHREARRHRCPACSATPGQDCKRSVSAAIRRRGTRWHHVARHGLGLGYSPDRSTERARAAEAIRSAPRTSPTTERTEP